MHFQRNSIGSVEHSPIFDNDVQQFADPISGATTPPKYPKHQMTNQEPTNVELQVQSLLKPNIKSKPKQRITRKKPQKPTTIGNTAEKIK